MLLLCISDWQAKQRAESLGFVHLHLYLPGRGRLSALPERHTVGVKAPIAAVYRSAEATAVRQPGSLLPCVRRGRSAGRPSVKNTPLLHPLGGKGAGGSLRWPFLKPTSIEQSNQESGSSLCKNLPIMEKA